MGITYQSDVEGIKDDQVAEGFFQGWPKKFYEQKGMRKASGMMIRHYANQAGKGDA